MTTQRDRFESTHPAKLKAKECADLVLLSLYVYIPPSWGVGGQDTGNNAPINVNPVGGGRVRARGGDLTAISISSEGGLIEYLCSGVGTFNFFSRETGTKIKRGYLASSFLALEWRGFGIRWVFYRCLSATS